MKMCSLPKASLLSLCLVGWVASSIGQTGVMPVVSVRATDPVATFSGDPGQFTLFRDGPTNMALQVFYRIGGTASNGVDYANIPNITPISAGARTATITISPINNGQTHNETVELQLAVPPFVPPQNYVIGNPSNATVVIYTNVSTNIPPFVAIVTPTNGSMFLDPANIPICAEAGDPDGYVATVEFFSDNVSIGVTTNNPYSTGPRNPFCLVYSNAPVGPHVLTALATDNGGATTLSAPVNITVKQGPPPPTNLPPVVRIVSPPSGAMFRAPVNIPIYSYAHDFDGSVVSVECFAGTNDLGPAHGICISAMSSNRPDCPTNIYLLVWSNAPLGTYRLTTVATDNGGASTVSEPVFVTILPPPPPPTNRPPVVAIYATDPIAIEGTNCWTWPCPTNSMTTYSNTWGGWSPTACRSFTNCGPKNATFAVRRFGATNDALTVNYAIGGTASNGVDYVALSGSVTIDAGEHTALITIVPIDDGPPDITTTVVLKVAPATNYVVGFPGAAGAIIVDGVWPRATAGMLPDGSFGLNSTGPNGAWFRVESSTDLQTWTGVCTNQVFNGSIDFVDPAAQGSQVHFYRTFPESGPPPQ